MGQNSNLTPTQHWELHQGLWHMLGCDMKLKHKNKNTVVYMDRKDNRYYSYSSLSGSIYLGNSLGYLKEKRNAN